MSGATTSLVDVLDRVLDVGAVIGGDAVVTVADVPLIHLGLRLVLRGIEDGPTSAGGVATVGGSVPTTARPPLERSADADPEVVVGDTAPGPPAARTDADPAPGDRAAPPSGVSSLDPEATQRGLAGLVLTLVETLRELLERQAVRRMESGSLDGEQLDRLGDALRDIRDAVERLSESFGLDPEDLTIDLGPLEDLL